MIAEIRHRKCRQQNIEEEARELNRGNNRISLIFAYAGLRTIHF